MSKLTKTTDLHPATAIIIESGRRLMDAYNAAPATWRYRIAGLMWDHLGVAAAVEGADIDELHRLLIAELEKAA